MAKIQLTIKTSYLPRWGVWEGLRELVQNGRDAETEHGATLKVDWYNDTLRIENEGTTLEQKALLLGHTTKGGRGDMIGQFGEGLKLGVLALVRAGIPVKIRTGDEVWTPTIEDSEQFGEPVLTFRIEGGREYKNRVRVEIGNVPKATWDGMKERFLFVTKPKGSEEIRTDQGSLLLGPQYKGCVFVKGIFVQKMADLSYGYDLRNADLDRDRKMVEFWNLRFRTKELLLAAMTQSTDKALLETFDTMLSEGALEVACIEDSYSARDVPDNVVDFIAAKFTARHGKDAIPVQSLADSKDIEHLGKKGVVVPKHLGAVLAKKLGDLATVKQNLQKETTRTYGWHELTMEERASLSEAVELVGKVKPVDMDQVQVVDFRDPAMRGQFDKGTSLLAKDILADKEETLAVLIHEVAHAKGGDGDHSHVCAIEDLWKGVVRVLRARG